MIKEAIQKFWAEKVFRKLTNAEKKYLTAGEVSAIETSGERIAIVYSRWDENNKAKFCESCGSELIYMKEEPFITYDSQTGEPVKNVRKSCLKHGKYY